MSKPKVGKGLKLSGPELQNKKREAEILISNWQASTKNNEHGCPEKLRAFNSFMGAQRASGLTMNHLGLPRKMEMALNAATQHYKHGGSEKRVA